MELSSLRSIKKLVEILACFLVIIGVLGPWLWRGYNSYQIYDPETGERELRYRLISKLSPFYVSAVYEDQSPNIEWFVSPETTLAGFMMLTASLIFILSSSYRMKVIAVSFVAFGCFFFFISLGGGLWLGLVTRFSWGVQVTLIGLILMLFLVLSDLFS